MIDIIYLFFIYNNILFIINNIQKILHILFFCWRKNMCNK